MATDQPASFRSLPAPVGLLYAAVLAAGVYDVASGVRGHGGQLAGTAAALVLLAALDAAERTGVVSARTTIRAVTALVVRAALVEAVVALDVSGTASLLRLLVAFSAQLALGAWAARAVATCYGLGLVVLVTAGRPLTPAAHGGWRDAQTVSTFVMSVVALVVVLVVAELVGTLYRAQLSAQRLASRLAATQEDLAQSAAAAERARVARDIHDGLGHHLTAVSVQLQKAELFLDREPSVAIRAVRDARDSSQLALREVRRSVAAVRGVERFHLTPALQALAGTPAEPRVEVDVRGDEQQVPAAALVAAYRVAQEALTNARRHAAARSIRLHVTVDAVNGVDVRVEDDGQGFRCPMPDGAPSLGSGHGLRGMRERVELLGGTLTVAAGADRGAVVHAWLPPGTPGAQ